jgi:transposase
MYGCQQVLIKSDKSTISILEYVCKEAKKLTNCGVYYCRQMHFKTGSIPSRVDLHKQLGTYHKNIHYQALYIDLGSKNNQKFVQIPTARLKDRIAQLCKQYGIDFMETEESYTSQSSFVDGDNIPKLGEKPEGWKAMGKRVGRGVYKTSDGFKINADCNGDAKS